MAHDLIHMAVLLSGDSPTKAAFARMDIGVAEVTLGLGAVVSKLLNGCLKAQRRRFTIKLFVVVHRWEGNPTIVAEWSATRKLRTSKLHPMPRGPGEDRKQLENPQIEHLVKKNKASATHSLSAQAYRSRIRFPAIRVRAALGREATVPQ